MRSFRRLARGLALAVSLTLATAPAAHADPAPAADVAEAKRLFELGLKLYKEGLYLEALASFKRAQELAPRANILRNIAQCHRDLKDFARAYDAYRELLDKYAPSLRPADGQAVKRALEELTVVTGAVHVRVNQPGATVRVDDRDLGPTPLDVAVRVNLGAHRVTAQGGGFEPFATDVSVASNGEASVTAVLEKQVLTGHVSIVVTGEGAVGARVFVDGQDAGPAPLELDLPAGAHDVEARADGAAAPKQSITVTKRGQLPLSLALEPRTGKLQVDPHAPLADIALDGKKLTRGVWEGTLAPGRHELTITLAGFEPYQRVFIVHAGENIVEDVHLRPNGPAAMAPTYQGIYSNLELFGVASPGGASTLFNEQCPSAPCTNDTPLGGGLGVRIGYSFGWVDAEGVIFGMYDTSTASLKYPTDSATTGPARTESYRFHTFGGGGAIGARVTSKHPNVRLTFGADFGVEVKGNLYARDASGIGANAGNDTTMTSKNVTYTAPVLLLDGGVLVGPADGPKVYIGALALFEFVGDPVLAPGDSTKTLGTATLPTPALQVASGVQFFIGPVLGLRFGQ